MIDYYVEGSKGNNATCKAQGFFIQMGTIAAFINVSLAVFYFCVIKLAWGEMRVNKIRRWLLLCPITVGLAFAFAGIPFYEMVCTHFSCLSISLNFSHLQYYLPLRLCSSFSGVTTVRHGGPTFPSPLRS